MEVSDIEKLLNDALELDELHVAFDGSQCKQRTWPLKILEYP